jgi:Tol biopolymer transport system component
MKRMRSIVKLAAGTVLIAAFGIGLAPQSAADLFQRALVKENAEGNLEEAIALFQQVVDKGGDEALAAQAQLHIGMCYEKLGLGKARESYQRVIDRYPKQAESVKAAREKLAALAIPPAAKPAGNREMNIRRVYDGTGPEWGNALSSDGRYLVYTDWETGDMAVVDMITREHRRLTHEGGLNKASGDMGETSAFSPDNKRIAYGWMIRNKIAELRAVNFDGTDPKVLYRDETAVWIRPQGWSKDGRTILMTLMRKDGSSDIALLSLADNKVNIVRHVQGKDPELDLAPDGKTIAFSMPSETTTPQRDVYLVKADGSGYAPIVVNPADDYLLGWTPDGDRLVFASDRTGSFGIWSLGIKDGKANGMPQWLKGDIVPSPVRLTSDGTLYYILSERITDIYTVPIDPVTGKLLDHPEPLKSRFPGTRTVPDWSPDGSRLAFKFFIGGEPVSIGPASISIFDVKSGEEQRIETGLKSQTPIASPRWAPDGRSILFIGSRGEGLGIYRIDVPGGEKTRLVSIPPHQYCFYAEWARDGKSIFYQISNPVRIKRHDIAAGQDVEIVTTSMQGVTSISPSPDGKWLAFPVRAELGSPVRLALVSPGGGPVREIYTTKAGEIIQGLQWTPDGQAIWIRKFTPAPNEKMQPVIECLSISPDGQHIRRLDPSLNSAGVFRIHPEGRQVAFAGGQFKVELWALENFLK